MTPDKNRIENAVYQPVFDKLSFMIDSNTKLPITFEEMLNHWHMIVVTKFPLATQSSDLIKLEKELDELKLEIIHENRTTQINEYADVLLCVFASVFHAGIPPAEILKAMRIKSVVNERRDWKYNGDGTYSHIKESDLNTPGPFCNHVFDTPPGESQTPICVKCGVDQSDSLPYILQP